VLSWFISILFTCFIFSTFFVLFLCFCMILLPFSPKKLSTLFLLYLGILLTFTLYILIFLIFLLLYLSLPFLETLFLPYWFFSVYISFQIILPVLAIIRCLCNHLTSFLLQHFYTSSINFYSVSDSILSFFVFKIIYVFVDKINFLFFSLIIKMILY